MRARFADGTEHTLQITVAEYRQCMGSKRTAAMAASEANLWFADHPTRHNLISIRQRKVDANKSMLLCIFEQGKAIAQTVIAQFGPLPDPQPSFVDSNNDTLHKALKFLQPFGEKYVKEEFADGDEVRAAVQRANAELRKSKRQQASAARSEAMKAQRMGRKEAAKEANEARKQARQAQRAEAGKEVEGEKGPKKRATDESEKKEKESSNNKKKKEKSEVVEETQTPGASSQSGNSLSPPPPAFLRGCMQPLLC